MDPNLVGKEKNMTIQNKLSVIISVEELAKIDAILNHFKDFNNQLQYQTILYFPEYTKAILTSFDSNLESGQEWINLQRNCMIFYGYGFKNAVVDLMKSVSSLDSEKFKFEDYDFESFMEYIECFAYANEGYCNAIIDQYKEYIRNDEQKKNTIRSINPKYYQRFFHESSYLKCTTGEYVVDRLKFDNEDINIYTIYNLIVLLHNYKRYDNNFDAELIQLHYKYLKYLYGPSRGIQLFHRQLANLHNMRIQPSEFEITITLKSISLTNSNDL